MKKPAMKSKEQCVKAAAIVGRTGHFRFSDVFRSSSEARKYLDEWGRIEPGDKPHTVVDVEIREVRK